MSRCSSVSIPSATTSMPSSCESRIRAGVVAQVLHEETVDLDHVDRQLHDPGERAVTGAEVVGGQLDPAVGQLGELAAQRVVGAGEERLGQLEHQELRRVAVSFQRREDEIGEPVVFELAARHIDVHRRRRGGTRLGQQGGRR